MQFNPLRWFVLTFFKDFPSSVRVQRPSKQGLSTYKPSSFLSFNQELFKGPLCGTRIHQLLGASRVDPRGKEASCSWIPWAPPCIPWAAPSWINVSILFKNSSGHCLHYRVFLWHDPRHYGYFRFQDYFVSCSHGSSFWKHSRAS